MADPKKPTRIFLDVETSRFQRKAGIPRTPFLKEFDFKLPPVIKDNLNVVAAAGAAVFIASLVRQNSRARKTQISGLQDEGIRQYLRHEQTDFGSGYRPDEDRPSLGLSALLATAAGAFALHKWKLAEDPAYAEKAYKFIKDVFEYKSPFHITSTYRAGEVLSSYIPERIAFKEMALVERLGGKAPQLTDRGAQLQKLFGSDLDVLKLKGDMVFERAKLGDPYLRLTQATSANGESLFQRGLSVRFMENGKLAGSAFRYGLPAEQAQLLETSIGTPPVQRFMGVRVPQFARPAVEDFVAFKKKQFAASPPFHNFPGYGLDQKSGLNFFPVFAKKEGENFAKQVWDRAKYVNYMLAERGHETVARTLGLGLPRGTYNSTTSLLGGLLVKRVLPAYALWTGVRYADYLTGHIGRNLGAGIAARTHLAYAAATDVVPGLRESADFNKEALPGPKYGPLALPATGAFIAGALHYGKLVTSAKTVSRAARKAEFMSHVGVGAAIGGAMALPFVPGMIGSRKSFDQLQREYAGVDQVPVRAGRWWDLGNESFAGGKISFYTPNWYQRLTKSTFVKGNYGSEKEYWGHQPLLHPVKYLKDPYWLERKWYHDRPFPITSPAFTNVPLIGDVLAATIGKAVKPVKRMHEGEWSDTDYEIGGPKNQPKGPFAKQADKLAEEYNLGHVINRQFERWADWGGLLGYHAKTLKKAIFGDEDLTPYMQGSRQMTNLSRLYYERQFGAMAFIGMENMEQVGYSEPIRRFITNEPKGIQINEIQNRMPSWLPGEGEYAFNFRAGDPYSRIPFGYLRLPGPGYEALHPELKGVDPESYPAITKLAILADVAPTSTKFYSYKAVVERQAEKDMGLKIELDRIISRVEEQKQSAIHAYEPKFRQAPDSISGTVEEATPEGVRLREYPGRVFKFSGVGLSAADMSAAALAQNNLSTRTELVRATERKQQAVSAYLSDAMKPGTRVSATVPVGSADHSQEVPAVFRAGGDVINRELIDRGFGTSRLRDAGPETQEMFGGVGRAVGHLGDQMVRIPSPYFSKLWNARPVEEEYLKNEYYGSKSRSWDSPVDDFVAPYFRGAVYHTTGVAMLSGKNEYRRDLDTMRDQMQYLRALDLAAQDPENRGRYMGQAARTNIGANMFSTPDRMELTLPRADRPYFQTMMEVTDPERRNRILRYATPELARSLSGQWLKQDLEIARADGKTDMPITAYRGRPVGTEFIRQKADYQGRVVDVIDGDSLVVQTEGGKKELRLADVNAPEMPTFAGRLAQQRTRELVMGRNVWVNVTQDADKYGRQVGEVFTDDSRFLNSDLQSQGKAEEMQFSSGETMAKAPSEYQRSREIADFFSRKKMHLPDAGSAAFAPELDYEDVKLKILQEEGYNYHDFGLFQDRAAVVNRKPYLDGAVRELSQPSGRSAESLRLSVEQMIANAYDKNPKVRAIDTVSFGSFSNITVTSRGDHEDEIRRDIRRHRSKWN